MQCAAQLSGFAVQFLKKTFQLMKDRARMFLENQTSRSKQDPLSAPLKQRNAKTSLQISHLLRNARLGDSEPVGRPAKASRFGDREEIPQVTNVQGVLHGKMNIARRARQMQSGSLIAGKSSASIGRTYCAISKTFEKAHDCEIHYLRFADSSAADGRV
jgi:hypothetical protein